MRLQWNQNEGRVDIALLFSALLTRTWISFRSSLTTNEGPSKFNTSATKDGNDWII